jgi:hypothetical protein
MGDKLDSMIAWWTDPKHISLRRATLSDGKYSYSIRYNLNNSEMEQNTKDSISLENTIHIEKFYIQTRDFLRLGPQEPVITIVENEYAKKNGLICLQKLNDKVQFNTPFGRRYKWLCYLDPQKNYLCNRTEEYLIQDSLWQKEFPNSQDHLIKNPDNTLDFTQLTVREVKEFGKTNSGKWYPKKIECLITTQGKTGKIRNSLSTETIYLDEEREIPKDVFDFNSFNKFLSK